MIGKSPSVSLPSDALLFPDLIDVCSLPSSLRMPEDPGTEFEASARFRKLTLLTLLTLLNFAHFAHFAHFAVTCGRLVASGVMALVLDRHFGEYVTLADAQVRTTQRIL